ncbi:CDP-alcohol phosphatidyltransferase family protein [Microlunatus soli]|uniref:CDP-alcohol phosphatidyltransferase n=1 Tax=Microlunatus soli TaxID=630515 RepID=A0A1H1V2M1_9ACTN|nr:CDP-alcohol phosphatidyltransferase family protein [Microlunatus soli]SDS78860.1 CDP-alcohol phosphatidyltransferase [Microlunatus soli]
MSDSLIGNAAARGIRGFSAGAGCVVLGNTEVGGRWPEILQQVCRPTAVTAADNLAGLAAAAAEPGGPLVVVDSGLQLELPGTLDLLDVPTDPTAALLADPRNVEAPRQPEHGLDRATTAGVDADGLLSGGAAPNRIVVGILRVNADDRARAATLWQQAAGSISKEPGEDPGRLFDLALQVLVDGGLPVMGKSLGYYTWSRGPVGQTGLGGSPWKQRLRTSSRLGDGAYSAAVVRPLSRVGTRLALSVGLTPNLVTAISLLVGIGSGLLVLTGNRPLWIVAAVLLQVALVIDCMDGEIARFTRRFSAFGGWLDGIGDRIKEYLVFAAVGAVAVREGHESGWLLAMIAMVIVTGRHLEDYSYGDRTAAVRAAATAANGPSTGSGSSADPGPPTSSGILPPVPSTRQRIAFWGKKIAHVPIAERYLILSLALLTGRPIWVLVAAIAVSAFALLWTFGGRLLRAFRAAPPPPVDTLDQQLDLGRLARASGRLRIPFLLGSVLLIGCWLLIILGICARLWPLSVAAGLIAVVLAGGALRPH